MKELIDEQMWHTPIKKQWEIDDNLLLVLIFNSDIYSSFSNKEQMFISNPWSISEKSH